MPSNLIWPHIQLSMCNVQCAWVCFDDTIISRTLSNVNGQYCTNISLVICAIWQSCKWPAGCVGMMNERTVHFNLITVRWVRAVRVALGMAWPAPRYKPQPTFSYEWSDSSFLTRTSGSRNLQMPPLRSKYHFSKIFWGLLTSPSLTS